MIDNKSGAGGAIGTDFVAKAAPDGYTLLCVSPSHATLTSLMKNLSWSPTKDFRGIEGVGVIPNVIVVPENSPSKTLEEFIAAAKQAPQPLTFATPGVGTSNFLSGELLAQLAGIKLAHIIYRGQPEALNDVLAGRIDMMPLTTVLAVPYVKDGKLRPLAVTTAVRSAALPNVPTVAQASNLKTYEVSSWFGFVVPARTPDAVVQKLSKDIAEILAMPELKPKFDTIGLMVEPRGPQAFDAFVASETKRWADVIAKSGIQPQ